jgi:hypothetical protein
MAPSTPSRSDTDRIEIDRDYLTELRNEARRWRRAYRSAVAALSTATGQAVADLDREFRRPGESA